MCVNKTANNNKCAPQTEIDAFFDKHINFLFQASFVNPVINANQPNHIDYYL